jgi:hypothetical protein
MLVGRKSSCVTSVTILYIGGIENMQGGCKLSCGSSGTILLLRWH